MREAVSCKHCCSMYGTLIFHTPCPFGQEKIEEMMSNMNTKYLAFGTIAITILLTSAFLAITPMALAGNGAPSGPHYNLNIIGVPVDKKGNFVDYNPITDGYNNPPAAHDNGHRIFVDLYNGETSTKIWLVKGDDFQVIDPNGTDGRATLQLKDPFLTDNPNSSDYWVVEYQIFVRALGKTNGEAWMTSGFLDENNTAWYSLETIHLVRSKDGPPKFDDKTLELTTVYVDITNDGIDNPVRYRLFDDALWQYFWDYDNNGLKLLQIRFYEIPTTLSGPGI